MWKHTVFVPLPKQQEEYEVETSAMEQACRFLNEKRRRPDQVQINTVVVQGMSGRQHTEVHVYWVDD